MSTSTNVVLEFSKSMNESATEAAFGASPAIGCDFSWNGDGTQLTCDPTGDLDPNQTYTVTLGSGAESEDGATLDGEHQFSFTTATVAGPSIVSTTPSDDATGVGTNTNLKVTFSEAMDRSATEGAFSSSPNVDCTFGWGAGDTVLTCNPDSGLAADTAYTVTIGGSAQSASGVSLGSSHSFGFETGSEALEACTLGSSQLGNCVLD